MGSGADRPGSSSDHRRGVVGTVRAGGDPVQGALVQPRGLDPQAPAVPELAIYTGADGRYWWPLPGGRWELTVSARGHRSAAKTVVVDESGPVTLDFTLEPAR